MQLYTGNRDGQVEGVDLRDLGSFACQVGQECIGCSYCTTSFLFQLFVFSFSFDSHTNKIYAMTEAFFLVFVVNSSLLCSFTSSVCLYLKKKKS